MTNRDAHAFGVWCKKENNVKKSKLIHSVFNKMVERHINQKSYKNDKNLSALIKDAYTSSFERGYYGRP